MDPEPGPPPSLVQAAGEGVAEGEEVAEVAKEQAGAVATVDELVAAAGPGTSQAGRAVHHRHHPHNNAAISCIKSI